MKPLNPKNPKELRQIRALHKQAQRKASLHYKLFGRIQSKLCRINGGVCGGATEFERTKAVMAVLVRAGLVRKMP